MRQPAVPDSPDSDPADDLLSRWVKDRPRTLPDPDDPGPDDRSPWSLSTDETAPPGRGMPFGGPSNESLQFLREFSLADPEDAEPTARRLPAPPDSETIVRRGAPAGHRASKPTGLIAGARGTAPASARPDASRNLPGPADVLAGFRIIEELGRGAFARVYLAEELRLGGRLVAIKVSRAEGDEPRILARLQHTNIVPVHSVCDDPATGLRVLCMPYFGGANLAQLLDTSGGLTTTGRGGHSLVEALDRISRAQPAAAEEFLRPSSGVMATCRSPARASRPRPLPLSDPGRSAGPSSPGGSIIAMGFRSLLVRIIGVGATPDPDRPDLGHPGDEIHQPSRQFLGRASAIQAAAWIVARLADGLDHAHSRGLLHRDLKPANILIAGDGTPMLLDFNLATENPGPSGEQEVGRALLGGTLPYMAPEHLDAFDPNGTTPADAVAERADIYALGLILFEMLAGAPPFPIPALPPGSSTAAMIGPMIDARRRPPSLRARCPLVPWSLDALVTKCLEFDPRRRYARARDLAEDLRRFLDDQPMKHTPEPSLRERAAKFARRHQAFCSSTSIATIAMVFILALGAGVSAVYSGMQGLIARFQRQAFEREFAGAQFLLNTAGGSDRHLEAGLVEARRLFDRLDLVEGRRDPGAAWFRSLTEAERSRLREQAIELTILEARARVLLASRRGDDADRLAAIRRAIAGLDQVERVAERVPAALYGERARYRAALGEAEAAEADRRRAAEARPSTAHDWTLLGTTLLAAGDPRAAEDALRQALRLEGTSFWAWFMAGHAHFAQGRYLEAAGDFSVCTALGPQFAWAHFNRGLALARAGQLAPARDAYDRALAIDPDFAEALVNRALVELQLDRVDAALADLTLAIRLGRREAGVLAARGEALARLGRTDQSRRWFDDLLAAEPDNAVVRVARGMTRIASDPAGGREDFERVLALDPSQAAAHYGMALLVRANDPRGALAHLDAAIDADPHLIDAIQLRALVRARQGDPAALDDVDRLLRSPTAHRCYNAACAVAVYCEKARDPRPLNRALDLLARAADLGFPMAEAAKDPDLAPLRDRPAFRRLMDRDAR